MEHLLQEQLPLRMVSWLKLYGNCVEKCFGWRGLLPQRRYAGDGAVEMGAAGQENPWRHSPPINYVTLRLEDRTRDATTAARLYRGAFCWGGEQKRKS